MIGIPFVECGQFPANFDDRLMTGLSLPFMFSWHCPKSTRSQCREAEGWATLGVTPVFVIKELSHVCNFTGDRPGRSV